MGLVSEILLLPLAPVRGAIKLAEVIQQEVERQLRNPATTRHELEELQLKRERGEISADQERQAQREVLETRIAPKPPMPVEQQAPAGPPGSAADDAPPPAGRGKSRKTLRRQGTRRNRRGRATKRACR